MLAVEAASRKMEALRIREYAVDPALAPFVKSVWSLESDGRVCEPARERILPDGCVELVFHFNDPFRSYLVEGFVNHYVLRSVSADGRRVVFVTVAIENIPAGWRARETYDFPSDDEFVETFALSQPGKDFATYSETRFRRRR
jgi:hypothetical protein